LMIDGVISDPFSMKTFPLPEPENWAEIKEKVRKQTRQSYAIERKRIESRIKLWADKSFSPTEKALEKAKTSDTDLKLEDLSTDKYYEWIVKLKYNFWLFVVLKWWKFEWLLHKKKMKVPENMNWKDVYQIWDKIKVKILKLTPDGKNMEFTQL
jgi:polyribonucleotide nucleotidyltransferase